MPSTIEVEVPDLLVQALGGDPSVISRRTLEALVVDAFKDEQISHAEVAQILGLSRWETDAFLNDHRAYPKSESAEYLADFEKLKGLLEK